MVERPFRSVLVIGMVLTFALYLPLNVVLSTQPSCPLLPIWMALPIIAGLAAVATLLLLRALSPLPRGIDATTTPAQWLGALRARAFVSFAVADLPVMFGILGSMANSNRLPFAAGAVVTLVLQLIFTLPLMRAVGRWTASNRTASNI